MHFSYRPASTRMPTYIPMRGGSTAALPPSARFPTYEPVMIPKEPTEYVSEETPEPTYVPIVGDDSRALPPTEYEEYVR